MDRSGGACFTFKAISGGFDFIEKYEENHLIEPLCMRNSNVGL